ncbi:MAG: SusD/RagB family nutrient-binding outer membrane lipoprotein [Rikenellaceae bacterium]|jgi:hypothetical protein|nr:SusD/RagB family nutrient-binding outer membrane lipoprotein [Rikenellaceae bacterium]
MKKANYMLLTAAVALSLGSCRHKFDEYNSNPNQMGKGSILPANMFETVICGVGNDLLKDTHGINGELIQYTVSGSSTNAYHRYVLPVGVTGGLWSDFAVWAANANEIMELSVKNSDNNSLAIGLTLRALCLSTLTDSFGDIPLRDAFKIGSGLTKPRFDPQQMVYDSIFENLERANKLYQISKGLNYPSKDLLFGGNIARWKKFTNSLYLRLLMRNVNRNLSYSIGGMNISQKIDQIVSSPALYPVIESNDENVSLNFTGVAPFRNYFADETEKNFNNSRSMAEYFVKTLDDAGDPRLSIFAVMGGSEWKGVPSGMPTQDTDGSGAAHIRQGALGTATTPYCFIKYDEVLFIKAEAAQRGIVAGGAALAEDYYKRAITASVKYWDAFRSSNAPPVSDATVEQLLAKLPYDNTLECIINQKYVALFWVGLEAWNEYRRTGYPNLTIGSGTSNSGILPRRFPYSVGSATTNPDNYAAQVKAMRDAYMDGGDNMLTPVWWSRDAEILQR